MKLLGAKKKIAYMIQVEKKKQKIEDLIEKSNHKTCNNFTSSYLITSHIVSTDQRLNFPAIPLVPRTYANY